MAETHHIVDSDEARGAWLAGARRAAGLTQEQAAHASGVKLGVIVKSEAGRDLRTSHFLTLVKTYRAERALADWLQGAKRLRVAEPSAPPLPASALRQVAKGEVSDEKKRRLR